MRLVRGPDVSRRRGQSTQVRCMRVRRGKGGIERDRGARGRLLRRFQRTIASVSFGAPRDFVLRRMQGEPYTATWKARQPPQHTRYTLGDADLLVMRGGTQRHYEHAVLKAAAGGERINVTFRSARVPQ